MALTKIPGELFSVGDLDISNVGTISLDAIEGDADSNTSITFSGSDVITIATGGSNRLTIGDGALSPVTDNQIDLGTSSLEFKDAYFDGTVTSDAFAGPLTGDVTGNVSGTAATVTGAAQSNITSLGTLTTLTVDNVIVNGTTIGHTSDTDLMTLADGVLTVAGEVDATSLDISGDVDIDGTLETDNLTVGGAQGSDGQVLTSTGSGVAWEDASGGATSVGGLDEGHAVSGSGNFAGSILISHDGTTGTLDNAYYNTGYGYEVFDKITSGDSNTAIGNQAGYDLTSSSNNTLVGRLAGGNVSTGGNHTLIGYQAGDAITDSVHNTVVGYEAQGASNGNYNTAIGDRALFATNGGDENTVVGSRAHYGSANSATRNTVVGVSAMEGATTGSYNSAFGMRALYLNAAGTENVASGYLCMDANTTGSYNVAYGVNALGGNQSGHNNVAIGTSALIAATSAGDNVAIGHSALAATNNTRNMGIGYRALTAQSGSSDNIAIGYDALVRQTTGANGNLAIGNYAGRAVVDSASTSQLIAIGQNVADSNTGALAGYQNVFIGYNIASSSSLAGAFQNTAVGGSTLTALTTGDDNTCLGKGAGSTITTGSRNILIGVGAATSAVGVNDEIVIGKDVGGGGASSFVFGSGSYDTKCEFNSTTWTNPSDIRLKEDIQDEVIGLDFINDLRPVTFRWKKEKDIPQTLRAYKEGSEKRAANGKYNHGFIAQEVKEVIDRYDLKDGFNMWSEDELDGRQRVGEAALMPLMVKAVQELSAKVEELEDKLKEK